MQNRKKNAKILQISRPPPAATLPSVVNGCPPDC